MNRKYDFKTYFWIFFIGSFVGVIIEELFWFVNTDVWESRRGLIYGPFNLVYGIGALLLTIGLKKIKKTKYDYIKIFLISFFIGSIFEYLCSIFQETMFGTVSWEYSTKILNLNGRITLKYSIFWGILGIVWIKLFIPLIRKILKKIPNNINTIIVSILLTFMALNSFISFMAAYRQNERYKNLPASNSFEKYLDKKYPDSFIDKIYPNSIRVK